MHISEWRLRRVIAFILGYWVGLAVLMGLTCYRPGIALMSAYEARHPEQQDVLFIFDSGLDERLIAALFIVPPIAFLAYRDWVGRRSTPPAV